MAHNVAVRLCRTRSGLQQASRFFQQTRTNSTSTSSKAGVPSFGPVSTPELEKKLKELREDLFVPMYMTSAQRRLMFRQKYREQLEQERIKVTIGDEEFVLAHRKYEQLPGKKDVKAAVEHMKTPKDWENLIPLVLGLRKSGFDIGVDFFEKWVRLAVRSGATSTIIELAKQFKRTGFSLSKYGVARELALSLSARAEAAGFKGDDVNTALRHAEQAAQLMNAPEHSNPDPSMDPKHQPFFIGTCLLLSAAHALEHGGGDAQKKVTSYAQKLLGSWPLAKLEPVSDNLIDQDQLLQENALVRMGLAMALKLPSVSSNKDLGNPIKQRLEDLDKVLSEYIGRISHEKPKRGVTVAQRALAL